MAVGSDVLTIVSTFLAWEKVELQREWQVGGMWEQCSFSPCGNFILTCAAGSSYALKLWGARSGELVRVFEDFTEEVHDCCFTPDGKTVVTAELDGMLRLWNVKTGTLSRTLEGHTDEVGGHAGDQERHKRDRREQREGPEGDREDRRGQRGGVRAGRKANAYAGGSP
jgi:WD40 repeat protein